MFDKFSLSESFLEGFRNKVVSWGPLGYVTYRRSYSRPIPEENRTEEWWETIQRVVEGTYSIQKWHCKRLKLPWNDNKAQKSAQEMYKLMFEMKFLPPGRGLWMMGVPYLAERGTSAPLYNCAFVSTKDINIDFAEPFTFLMDMSMLGVGVGFNTKGAGLVKIKEPTQGTDLHTVEDTREAWVHLIQRILNAYVKKDSLPVSIDYSKIRPYGVPIKGFGGTSSGPQPLIELVSNIHKILTPLIGEFITSSAIVDINNAIGRCVVSGNVRRSSEIALGDLNDQEFLELKDPDKHPEELKEWRWASNNSVIVKVGDDYTKVVERTIQNGEPGYFWLNNARGHGRFIDLPSPKDAKVEGCNPCQPAWATVLTPSGIATIGNIKIDDIIWSGKQWTKVKDKWSTGVKKVFGFRTRAGVFYGTENHKVISAGERIEAGEAETIDTSQGPTYTSFLSVIDNEMQNFVMDGLVIGDGSVHKASGDLVGLHVGQNDQDYFSDPICRLIKKHRPGIDSTFYEIQTSIKPDELVKTYERRIPDRYRFANETTKCMFLRGLYSANGSVVSSRVTLKSASIKMIEDTQEMLSSLGIRSYYTVNKSSVTKFKNGEYECKESYDLNISSDRERFSAIIGFIQKYKTEKLNQIINFTNKSKFASGKSKTSYEVISREFVAEEEVFDLTVEAEEHTYWTGGLLVSNCSEISLESFEFCNVPETFPSRHSSYKEYERTLKFAYLYAKTVTLLPTHNDRVNAVQLRNRRIGLSMTGIVQNIQKIGIREHFDWCNGGYLYLRQLDSVYSDWLCVPKSIKITSVKPSGSISLLPGVTPGIHFPKAEYYWRTMRVDSHSQLTKALINANYTVVKGEGHNTSIVYFPVKEEYFSKSIKDISMWEQLEIAAQMQYYWADNQVSVTIEFDPKTEAKDIARALSLYETRLKSVSFLPKEDHKYEHAPYQPITREEYEEAIKKLKPINFSQSLETEGFDNKYCDADGVCQIPLKSPNV